MIEYPKVIRVGGVTLTVKDADEEARWMKPALAGSEVVSAPVVEPEPEPEPVAEPEAAPVEPLKKKRAGKKYQ